MKVTDNTIFLQHPIILKGLKPVHIRKVEHKLIPFKEEKVIITPNGDNQPDSTVIALAVTLTDAGREIYEQLLEKENNEEE